MKFDSEAQLAERVLAYLQLEGWATYQEVEGRGGIADIVATRGPAVWVIECKLRFGFDVIAQASEWRPYAHRVSIAVHRYPRRRAHAVLLRSLRAHGIGMLDVIRDDYSGALEATREIVFPRFKRDADVAKLRAGLCEEMNQHGTAGAPCGTRWTPFRRTADNVRRYVEQHPGELVKTVIEEVQHHYHNPKSARATLAARVRDGIVPGVEIRKVSGRLRLYPAAEASP